MTSTSLASLDSILAVDVEDRDQAWETGFLKAIGSEPVHVLSPDPREGPDHWPYLMVATGEGSDEPLAQVLLWLSERGIGLALNPQKPTPDYVFTYGMIWNFRERGEFLTAVSMTAPSDTKLEFSPGQKLLTGPPSESHLPKYVRAVIKQFFADQGVFGPKVLMVSVDQKHFDLCFSIESLKAPPAHEHANIAEAVSWFLPAHYTVALVSEKTIPGFEAL